MESNPENVLSFAGLQDAFFLRCRSIMAQRSCTWCCLAIDIEHFKLFNDLYGIPRGDMLLSAISGILHDLEDGNLCAAAYLGMDDFAVFMPYDTELIGTLYDSLRTLTEEMGNSLGFMPAIGVYPLEPGESVSITAYDKAARAVTDAKKNRANRVRVHDEAAYIRERDEYQLLLDLKRAADEDLLAFYLQPQCRISTRKIVGAEALARWIKKDGSMVSPGIFIPVLERNGFIADFDKLIWEKVFRWLRSLLDRSIEPVPISLNVSQIDILTMDVVEVLCGLCSEYRVPERLIKVEITETAFAEATDRVCSLVKALRSKGFLTMMDDFGSGYSSLNMLENISVDVLKLDMAFVKEANLSSRKGITIIESIINMAKMMGLPVVVEGTETESQIRFLKDLGCRYAQGYYFYRPLPVSEFEKLMVSGSNLDHRGFLCKMNEQFHVREFLDENTFTDAMLNKILGPVAFYCLDGKDLTITRFNEQFYNAIADASMETRQVAIQNYVVKEDWPALYRALDEAFANVAGGSSCEIRFYKSDDSIFWFRMRFFYLRSDQDKRIYYGQVEDVTEARQQSLQLLEVLRGQSDVAMMLNLDQQTIQYVPAGNSIYQLGLPSIDLNVSIGLTSQARIENDDERRRFTDFFSISRLKSAYLKAIYHESITVSFRLTGKFEPVLFSTYYIRQSKDQDLIVYAFAKRLRDSDGHK